MKITSSPPQYNKPIFQRMPAFESYADIFGKELLDVFEKQTVTPQRAKTIVEKFRNALNDIINGKNCLGRGFHGSVYAVDDNFALKFKSLRELLNFDDYIWPFTLNPPKFSELKTYMGETLGQIGYIKILKNVGKHTPAGLTPEIRQWGSDRMEYNYYNHVYLPLFAKVPQESYDAIAEDFARLNNMKASEDEYYSFDSVNANNILLKDDKLFLIDDIDVVDYPDQNSTGKLLELLLYKTDITDYIKDYGTSINSAKKLLRKIILAAVKADLPHDTRGKDFTVWNHVFHNCNIKTDYETFVQNLEIIGWKNPDLEKKLARTKEYIDKTINPPNK